MISHLDVASKWDICIWKPHVSTHTQTPNILAMASIVDRQISQYLQKCVGGGNKTSKFQNIQNWLHVLYNILYTNEVFITTHVFLNLELLIYEYDLIYLESCGLANWKLFKENHRVSFQKSLLRFWDRSPREVLNKLE